MQAPQESWTVKRLLAWAAEDFRRRGLESARLDAEVLLAYVLGVERIRLFTEPERELSAGELATYRECIRRRRTREPVAYIVGVREFYGRPFKVDSRVLVPRPETELLVETALKQTETHDMYGRALDLCTGSGCVAISFALERPTWVVHAVELDPGALAVAELNALRLGAAFSLRFFEGDLFAPLTGEAPFHLITANPPYISRAELSETEPDVREHEPRLALESGVDGLDCMRRLVAEAPRWLVAGGHLAVEMAYNQGQAVSELFSAAGFADVRVLKDYGGRDRVVLGRRN
jgi:release factor glutamine methyltransferase